MCRSSLGNREGRDRETPNRRDTVRLAQLIQLSMDECFRLPRNGRPLEEHAAHPVAEHTNTPSFNPAHLRVETPLDRVCKIEDFFEMAPAHMLREFCRFVFVGPRLHEPDHVKQILPAETRSV